MSQKSLHQEFSELESKLARVLGLYSKLRQENKALREQQDELVEERARLIEKNEMARAKVEQMITRLKSMETS